MKDSFKFNRAEGGTCILLLWFKANLELVRNVLCFIYTYVQHGRHFGLKTFQQLLSPPASSLVDVSAQQSALAAIRHSE